MEESRYLIQYGSYILSNNRFGVNSGDHYSSVIKETQFQSGARSSGATVLNTRNKERNISINGIARKADSEYLLDNITTIDNVFGKNDQLFRVAPNWRKIFYVGSTTGWSAGSDASNLRINTKDIQVSPNTLLFDIDVSQSVNNFADLEATFTPVDLSSVTNTGNFEFALKLPDVENISDVTFRIGNDASNYYSYVFNTDYQGVRFQYGWNWFSIPWGDLALKSGQTYIEKVSETGTVDDSAIDYLYLKIDYTEDQTDITGCGFGGCVWVNEKEIRNYPCYLNSAVVKQQAGGNQNDMIKWQAQLLNYTGYSRATHEVQLFNVTGVTSTSISQKIDLDGNTEQLPETRISVVSAGGLSVFQQRSSRSSNIVSFTPVVVDVGDTAILGGINKQYEINGAQLDINGIIPNYEPGINRTILAFQTTSQYSVSYTDLPGKVPSSLSFRQPGWIAQSFTVPTAGELVEISFNLKQTFGGPSNKALTRFSFHTNNVNVPGTLLYESGNITVEGADYQKYSAIVTGTLSLVTGTTYWVRAREYGGQFFDAGGAVTGTYPNGSVVYYTDIVGTVTAPSADLWFDVVVDTAFTAQVDVAQSYYPLYK